MDSPDVRHAFIHKDTLESLKTIGGRGTISGMRRDVSDVQVVVISEIDYKDSLVLENTVIGLKNQISDLKGEISDLKSKNDSLRDEVDGLKDELASLK